MCCLLVDSSTLSVTGIAVGKRESRAGYHVQRGYGRLDSVREPLLDPLDFSALAQYRQHQQQQQQMMGMAGTGVVNWHGAMNGASTDHERSCAVAAQPVVGHGQQHEDNTTQRRGHVEALMGYIL